MAGKLNQAAVEGMDQAARVVHTKPFNLEHAKAGAPFCGDKGQRLVIMAWDRNHPSHPIVGMEIDGDQEVVAFRDDGETDHNCGFLTKRLVMTPLGYVDGKPVFVDDELVFDSPTAPPQKHVAVPEDRSFPMCSWPAPAKVYPETRMTDGDLIYTAACDVDTGVLRDIANAALRHAIDAGQVVVPRFTDDEFIDLDKLESLFLEQIQAAEKKTGRSTAEHAVCMRAFRETYRAANCFGGLHADHKQASVELGKAERLLESMGFRSVGNGDWQRGPSPVKCFYGHPKKGLYVEGDKASIDKVTAIVARDEARDMAVAEAVRVECFENANAFCTDVRMRANFDGIDLSAIIAKVPS